MKMDKQRPKHVEALNLNKSESGSESESKVCIKLVVFCICVKCLLPPGDNPIAVKNKYYYYYYLLYEGYLYIYS
jgi:hypothetical protein